MRMKSRIKFNNKWYAECYTREGVLRWQDSFINIVTDEGKTQLLNVYFTSAPKPLHYMGLAGAVVASASASSSIGGFGFAEFTGYTGNRKEITFTSATVKQITHSAVSFSINTSGSVEGGFTATTATGSAGGVLFAAGAFSVTRFVDNGDTVNVTHVVSIA